MWKFKKWKRENRRKKIDKENDYPKFIIAGNFILTVTFNI